MAAPNPSPTLISKSTFLFFIFIQCIFNYSFKDLKRIFLALQILFLNVFVLISCCTLLLFCCVTLI